MAASLVQSKSAAQNTGLATVNVSWDVAATAGNDLVIIVGSDDYAASPPTGFTQHTGCGQDTFLGHYVWTKKATGGETSTSYTIGSAAPSCWITKEISGLDASPYDISAGQLVASAGSTYTTPAITPTAGDRYLIASIGGSSSSSSCTLATWLNSFTERQDIGTTLGSGTRDTVGAADLAVTANGSTSYSSGATYSASRESRTGIIIAFKVATAALTLTQEGYRWRNDDGSETTATWKAAQDTPATIPPDEVTRLRMLVDAAGNPASQQYKLQYRKVGVASWRDVDTQG